MDSQHIFLTPQPPSSLPISSHLSTQNAKMPLSHHQQQQQQQCAICGTTQDLLRCSKCKTIYYCSIQHQHIDWPNHKHECRLLAKQRLNNIKLQQVTNGCNAINISGPTINVPASSISSSAISAPLSNLPASNIILGTHENEILYSKAESVTQPANSLGYFGNMLANSTTMEQMHAHNGILFNTDNHSSLVIDNLYYQPLRQSSAIQNYTPQQQQQEQEQQQHIFCQQTDTPQEIIQNPQFSNQHMINQYEKSSSYQIGTAAILDDHIMGNAKSGQKIILIDNLRKDTF
uniref:MYND-type domain-containing protein n=1 Tax=Glossina brevipalpis TaxID=37001 RepID=A0A1A9WFU9_9MUSC